VRVGVLRAEPMSIRISSVVCAAFTALLLIACPQDSDKQSGVSGGVSDENKPAAAQPANPPPVTPPQSAPTAAVPAGGEPPAAAGPSVEEGKRLYFMTCANCHGPDGSGAMMRQMLPKIGDLTSAEMHGRMKDEDIDKLIVTGRDKMPPLESVLKPEQRKSVIMFVRSLKKG
jgi:mono/diheme cytochrome c family protein